MELTSDGLACAVTHGPSSSKLRTVPPVDNGGDGTSFSPTDLVGAALLSCAVTTMALAATREGLPWGAVRGSVEKQMSPPPRRIAALVVRIEMPTELPHEHRARFEQIARECPVARSLHSELQLPIEFVYPG